MRNTSSSVLPIPENAFFEQAVFDQELSQGLLELARFSLELLDLVRGGLTRRVAGEPFLARLQELLRPMVVQVLIDPFLAAQLRNAVFAAQAFQHDADLLFSGMMPLCEYPGLSFQRSPVCACSLVSSLLLSGATMSQQSSLTQVCRVSEQEAQSTSGVTVTLPIAARAHEPRLGGSFRL